MNMFLTYYLICVVYCVYQLSKRWRRDATAGGLGITPGLDMIAVLMLAWVLAPIDAFLTWVRLYKDAEQARIDNQDKIL
jgi:hypothetical protein